jgi:pimeloyl-ACP methyl ester carboxylesterase
MNNMRKHGHKPFNIAVIHGGPGAGGEMYSVARELSPDNGVLEPFQTSCSIEGQLDELKSVLESNGNLPLIIIGFSWGAWLSYIFAAYYPLIVKRLILVSSGVFEEKFEEKYAANSVETRLSRLTVSEKKEALSLLSALNNDELNTDCFVRFGELMGKADSYDSLPPDHESSVDNPRVRPDIYQQVWRQATKLRANGQLLELGKRIECPVVAIHGDYDPYPGEGVRDPLSRVIKDFRFILLRQCGHYPWLERNAKEPFYETLRREISPQTVSS